MKNQNKYWLIGFLIITIFGLLFLPYLVTQTSILNVFNIYYGESHEIGDMIGGIIGPFVTLMSAGLIYLTLIEQIAMNDEFKKRFEKEDQEKKEDFVYKEIVSNLKTVNDLISNFTYKDYRGHTSNGVSAINALTRDVAFLYKENNKAYIDKEFKSDIWYKELSGYIISYLEILDRIYLFWKRGYDVMEEKIKLEILILELEKIRLSLLGLSPILVLEFINLPEVIVGHKEFKNREDLTMHYVYTKILKLEYNLNLKAYPNGKSRNQSDLNIIFQHLPQIEKFSFQNTS